MELSLTRDEIDAALSPWIIREHPVRAPAWRAIRLGNTLKFRLKAASRSIGSRLLPRVRPTSEHRDPEFVDGHYSRRWTQSPWPDPAETPSRRNIVYLERGDTGYETLGFGRGRCHLLGIAKAIEQLRPASVLEIGSGPGINLLALAGVFPEIAFSGAELTMAGVRSARALQSEPLPGHVEQVAPMRLKSRTAYRDVRFQQADVQNLPFPDEAFDLVYSRLAIEQMEQIRDRALAEIHRVTKRHAVFVEPFPDFNQDPLQVLATRTSNYISLAVDDLPRHGFEPIFRFSDWPHKITNGAGMVVCRRI